MLALPKRAIVTAGLASILATGACGCSSTTETKVEVSTESTDENGSMIKTTETTTTTTKDGSTTQETETTTFPIVDIREWTDAWEGTDENGDTVFYAQNVEEDGRSQALIAIYSPDEDALEYYRIGDFTEDEDGTITIFDANGSGDGFRFGIVSAGDNGTTTLDLGDEYGEAVVEPVDMDTFVDDIEEADTEGEFVE